MREEEEPVEKAAERGVGGIDVKGARGATAGREGGSLSQDRQGDASRRDRPPGRWPCLPLDFTSAPHLGLFRDSLENEFALC